MSESDVVKREGVQNVERCYEKPERLYLVDGFGLLYRSYFALVKTTMTAKDMFDTRAVYGFANVLLSLLQKHVDGQSVIVVFEGRRNEGELDHRRAQYPEYKSGRSKTPPGIIAAIPWVKRLVIALGLTFVEQHLYEADDVIGTLVRRAKRDGVSTVIVSVDKDFRQLLDGELVTILKPGAKDKPFEKVTEDTFRSEFEGLHPSRYIDVLTLVGDSADSIKGVPGIGPRSAPKLIKYFGSLEALLDAARRLAPPNEHMKWTTRNLPQDLKEIAKELPLRKADSLRYYEQRTLLMKSMVTIRDNVSVPELPWSEYLRRSVNRSEVDDICDRLEFTKALRMRMHRSAENVGDRYLTMEKGESRSTISKLENARGESESINYKLAELAEARSNKLMSDQIGTAVSANYVDALIDEDDSIEQILSQVTDCVGISMILSETDMGFPVLEGIAVSVGPQVSVFVSCKDMSALPKSLVRVLLDGAVEKAGWFMKDNFKALLSTHDMFMQGRPFDVRIAADLLHAGRRLSDSAMANKYLWKDALKSSLDVEEVKQLSFPTTREEALVLSDLGLRLTRKLKVELRETGLEHTAEHVEFPLIPTVAEMELFGVPLQVKALQTFEVHVKERLAVLESKLQSIAPTSGERPFRPSSLRDVSDALFVHWRLKSAKAPSESGHYSVDKRVLTSVAQNMNLRDEQREFGRLMLEYRETVKIVNTYTKSLLSSVRPDGRIRATIVQDASPSGRLSTSKPNLQSVPVRSALGREVRRTVQARPDFEVLCADYSQIELRILAAMSADDALCGALARGDDIHATIAARIFDVDVTEVNADQRARAKQVVYSIPYGISASGLAAQLGIAVDEARGLIKSFYVSFPAVHSLTKRLVAEARSNGYAKTLAGRRLQLPMLLLGAPQERRAAERLAVNMPVQGTQADMIKIAMVRIAKRLRDGGAKSRLILQVHDELVLEVCKQERDAVIDVVREEMCYALPLPGVEVEIHVGFGESWLTAASH